MTTVTASELDLAAYLTRIGQNGPMPVDADTLARLHLAHVSQIPFENLDVLLGRPIQLELDAVHEKLVNAKRGGYCYEQNALFAAVLERLGFGVHRWAARVRLGNVGVRPRTHMLLGVALGGERWLVDVGFGARGLLRPMPLVAGHVAEQEGWRYRLVREADGTWVLQSLTADGAQDLYAFGCEPQWPADYEMANFYTSQAPHSLFRRVLTVQRTMLPRRLILADLELTIDFGGERRVERIAAGELPNLLRDRFGLVLAEDDMRRLQAFAEEAQLRKDFQSM